MVLYGLKHGESEYNHQFIVTKAKNIIIAIFFCENGENFVQHKIYFAVSK